MTSIVCAPLPGVETLIKNPCYFYLVLVELFGQGIRIFRMLVFLWLTQ